MNIKNIKNTLKTMGLFSLTLNLNATDAKLVEAKIFETSIVTKMLGEDKGMELTEFETLITNLETMNKKFDDSVTKATEDKKKKESVPIPTFETFAETNGFILKIKDGEKTENITFKFKTKDDLEKAIKELKSIKEEANIDKKGFFSKNCKFWEFCFTNYDKEGTKIVKTFNKSKLAIDLILVAGVGALSYFGYKYYATETSSDATVEVA